MKKFLLASLLVLSGAVGAHGSSESFGITIGGSSGSSYGSLSYGYSSGSRDVYVVTPGYYESRSYVVPHAEVVVPHHGHSHVIVTPDRGGYWARHNRIKNDHLYGHRRGHHSHGSVVGPIYGKSHHKGHKGGGKHKH